MYGDPGVVRLSALFRLLRLKYLGEELSTSAKLSSIPDVSPHSVARTVNWFSQDSGGGTTFEGIACVFLRSKVKRTAATSCSC